MSGPRTLHLTLTVPGFTSGAEVVQWLDQLRAATGAPVLFTVCVHDATTEMLPSHLTGALDDADKSR